MDVRSYVVEGPGPQNRADTIAEFAAALTRLRTSVGNPSFRELSGRSRAISHTTLHEATRGNRLPSWSTTVEFVKACGADPAEYRERWDKADRELHRGQGSVPHPASLPRQATGPGGRVDVTEVVSMSEPTEPSPIRPNGPIDPSGPVEADCPAGPVGQTGRVGTAGRGGLGRRPLGILITLATILVAVGGIFIVNGWRPSAGLTDSSRQSTASATPIPASDCPLTAQNPPPAEPAHEGDASLFVEDVTLPDCTHVGRAETHEKIWRIRNAGTLTWVGYHLHRIDSDQDRHHCQTIEDVPVRKTEPGQTVDVAVSVVTADTPGLCVVRFKMRDAAGQVAFPGKRPVNFQLIID